MKHILIFTVFSILSLNLALANYPNFGVYEPSQPIITPGGVKTVYTPIVTEDPKTKEAVAGVVMAQPTPQPLNALDVLRRELQTIQMQEQQQAERDGVFKSTNKRFTPESLTFFLAIGGVTYNAMWIKSHGDPLAMERHILSLKDPIAHLSFYTFMQANGFYINFKTKDMDAHTKAQMMRRFSYQGMAVGSLASSIVADLGHSAKMCVDFWIKGKNDEQSVAHCNEAWKQWTVRGKFTQYFPQIVSMWASQWVTEILDRHTRAGFRYASTSTLAEKILNKKWLVNNVYKMTGADLAVSVSGGTFAVKGIRFLGKVTQFTMFVGVDHFISGYTYRPLNNLIRPLFVDFDILAINKTWTVYDDLKWNEAKIAEISGKCYDRYGAAGIHSENIRCQSVLELDKEIVAYGKQMQQWREHLNSDVETDLAGWMEMTKKLLNQVDYAYKFYRSFTNNLFETLNAGHRIRTKEATPQIMVHKTNYPFRLLPLFGVSMGEIQLSGGSPNDLYLDKPWEIEERQMEHIHMVGTTKPELFYLSLTQEEKAKYDKILSKLASKDKKVIVTTLNEINQIADSNFDLSKYWVAIKRLREKLGNPRPAVYPLAGFSQAFAANEIHKLTAIDADYSLWSVTKKYKFNKETDLMTYKIICGGFQSSFDKTTIGGIDMMMPQFDPPTLLLKDEKRSQFCDQLRTTANLYNTKIDGKDLSNYLIDKLNYNALGDYRDKKTLGQFDRWWVLNGKAPTAALFNEYDKKFARLVELTHQNMFDQKSFYKFAVDKFLNQSRYLKSNIREQMNVELELYLQLIQRALTPEIATQFEKDFDGNRNYMEQVMYKAERPTFIGFNSVTYTQVQKVRELMREYNELIRRVTPAKFDEYIAFSKKIDEALKEIGVAAGLVKLDLKKTEECDEVFDLSAPPSTTGSEMTEKVYTDIKVDKPTLRQKVIMAAVNGIRQLESENRRFIRMKIVLSQGLELDTREFMNDWDNSNKGELQNTKVRSASPRGGGG